MVVSLGRTACSNFWFALLACLVLCTSLASANGKNDDSDSNNLGLLAQACAQYCHTGTSGLDLWLSLEEGCDDAVSQPYLKAILSDDMLLSDDGGWPVSAAVLLWTGVWMGSMYAGYVSGMRVGSKNKGLYPVA